MRSKIRRDSAYFRVQLQPIKDSAHYAFLLITHQMASSPFFQPAGHVCGLIRNDRVRDSCFGAEIRGRKFRNQLFATIYGASERGTFAYPFSRKAFLMVGAMRQFMLGSVPRVYFVS
jgi:hypothetical protein